MDWEQKLNSLIVEDEQRSRVKLKLFNMDTVQRACLFDDVDGAVRASLLGLIEPAGAGAVGETYEPKRRRTGHPVDLFEATVDEQCGYIRNLLARPHELPNRATELLAFLSTKSGPLPVLSRITVTSVKDPELVKLSSPAQSEMALLVESALNTCRRRPNNEADSSHMLRAVTGDFLESLNELAPLNEKLLHLDSTMDSARTPGSTSDSSALVRLQRPGFALYLHDALILRWENKFDNAQFPLAMLENRQKLKVWSPLYYGELPYAIGGCCGGRIFQWLKLSPKGKDIVAESISKQFDLWTPSSVAALLHSVVQMHRLLQLLQGTLITTFPVRLYKEIKRENGTVVLGPDHVVKTLVPALTGDKVDFLAALYASITGSKYLVQLQGIRKRRNSTVLSLSPVGHPIAKPFDLKGLQNATHDMLHGLVVLHQANYTHRDLRWDNCIRELVRGEWKWVIIDLESAGEDGEKWEREGLVNWDAKTLNRNKSYSKGSDIYELGKLILNWLDESGEYSDGGKLMRALGEKMVKERGEALKMLGDVCPKGCARCVFFNT